MKSNDSNEEAIVDFVKQHEELFDKTHAKFKTDRGKKDSGKQLLRPEICLSRSGSTLHVPDMAISHVRSICSQKHRKTDLVEGQFQLSTRSHQKEGCGLSAPTVSHYLCPLFHGHQQYSKSTG